MFFDVLHRLLYNEFIWQESLFPAQIYERLYVKENYNERTALYYSGK